MNATRTLRLAVCASFLVLFANQFAPVHAQGRRGQTAEDEVPVPMSESSSQLTRMRLHVVSAKTKEPVEGVDLQFTGRVGIRSANRTLKTDAEGNADFNYSSGVTASQFRIVTKKAGYVPLNYYWRTNQIELPKDLEVKLEPGTKLGGIVVDEQKRPIAGARISFSMPVTFPLAESIYYSVATLSSDREGRWIWNEAPSDLSSLSSGVSHPDYLNPSIQLAAGIENVFTLKQGISVRGTVVDQNDTPVGFARIRLGENRYSDGRSETVTDADGNFQLKNCPLGATFVLAQTDTHAPQMQRVVVSAENEPVKFKLEPGQLLRGRVVDPDGNPLRGVTVAPEYWQGRQILDNRITTSAEGRFEWKTAPVDGVKYSIFRAGSMSVRDHLLIANGDEHVITMQPALVVSGSVTDAETGEPIRKFRVQRGQEQGGGSRYWYQNESTGATLAEGSFTFTFTEPMATGWLLRVLVDGYLPNESRPFTESSGNIKFDFALKKGSGPTGVVLLPNGEPAAGAQIGLWRQNRYIQISQGRFNTRSSDTSIITADDQGRFTLEPQSDKEAFLLVVLHDAGCADVSNTEFAKSNQIKLTGWGKLEGQVYKGDKPDVSCYVTYAPQRQPDQNDPVRRNFYGFNYQVRTDSEGRFSFDRVVPGKGSVSRIVVTQWGNSSMHSPGWNTPVEIKTDETAKVKIGGVGRPVKGKIVTNREPDSPIAWASNDPAQVSPRAKQQPSLIGRIFGQAPTPGPTVDPNMRYLGGFDEKGQFTIPDVPAGDYTLVVSISEPRSEYSSGNNIGSASFEFTVPKMDGDRSDEPLDLGVIAGTLSPVLEPGQAAPAIDIPGVDGKLIRMADFKGKLVVVSFISGNRDSDMSSLPVLKRVYDKFGKDANFAMVTVWCGYDTESIKKNIEGSGLKWPQAIAQNYGMGPPQAYLVRSMPTTFLIGTNGKVISRNAKEDELKKSIDSILSLGDLFFGEQPEK